MTTLKDYLRDMIEDAFVLGENAERNDIKTIEDAKEDLLDEYLKMIIERIIGV